MFRRALLAFALLSFLPSPATSQSGTIYLDDGTELEFLSFESFDYCPATPFFPEAAPDGAELHVEYQGATRSIGIEHLRSIEVKNWEGMEDDFAFSLCMQPGATRLRVEATRVTDEMPISALLVGVVVQLEDPFSGERTRQAFHFLAQPRPGESMELNIRRIVFKDSPG